MSVEMLAVYPVSEYRLVIVLPPVLQESIGKLKKSFSDTYQCPASVSGLSVITLIRFQQYEMMEPKIIHRIALLARAQHAFLVELSGFAGLPTHSIYIPCTTQVALSENTKTFRSLLSLLKPDKERKPHFVNDPYVPFASKLIPWQYEKGWLEMRHTHFSGKCMVGDYWLQKRKEGGTQFENLKKFPLMHIRETCEQGNLFS